MVEGLPGAELAAAEEGEARAESSIPSCCTLARGTGDAVCVGTPVIVGSPLGAPFTTRGTSGLALAVEARAGEELADVLSDVRVKIALGTSHVEGIGDVFTAL